LKTLLADDELNAEEFDIYQALLKWGKAQVAAGRTDAKEDKKDEKEDSKAVSTIVATVMPSIRFPLMPLDKIAGVIAPSGIMGQDQLLELFKFVSLSDEKEKEAAGPTLGFPWKERSGGGSLGIEKESKILSKKLFSDKKLAAAFTRYFMTPSAATKPTGPKPKAKFTLLYRGTRDGLTASTWHSRCDNKGPTLIVVKAVGRANIFGGYSSLDWNSSSGWSASGTGACWLFSLVNSHNKPTRIENSASTISNNMYNNSGYGPTWGSGHDLHITSSMSSSSNSCSPSNYRQITTGFPVVSVDSSLLAGVSSFQVEEIECFGVTGYSYTRYGM